MKRSLRYNFANLRIINFAKAILLAVFLIAFLILSLKYNNGKLDQEPKLLHRYSEVQFRHLENVKNRTKINLGFCKNVKIADEHYVRSRSSCNANEKHCTINKSYNNSIEYYKKKKIKIGFIIEHVTMIVKTGGRHESLIKMCKSMWKYYPKLKSIIVDDFKENASFKFILFLKNYSSYLTYIPTNQFTGISRGRNIALSLVKTKYFLLLDDDYNFNSKTNLMTLASILESTDATIAGGEHRVGHDTICNYFGIFLTKHHNKITLFHINGRVYEEIIGFKNCYRVDITKNFYIARTNVILQNGGWNNDLQYMEHEDFFLRLAYTKKKVVWCGDIRISHCQKPDDLRRKRESHAVYDQEKWISFHNFTNYDWITDP